MVDAHASALADIAAVYPTASLLCKTRPGAIRTAPFCFPSQTFTRLRFRNKDCCQETFNCSAYFLLCWDHWSSHSFYSSALRVNTAWSSRESWGASTPQLRGEENCNFWGALSGTGNPSKISSIMSALCICFKLEITEFEEFECGWGMQNPPRA